MHVDEHRDAVRASRHGLSILVDQGDADPGRDVLGRDLTSLCSRRGLSIGLGRHDRWEPQWDRRDWLDRERAATNHGPEVPLDLARSCS
jgi:hypothetical protein